MIRINLLGEKEDYSARYLLQSIAVVEGLMAAISLCFVFHTNAVARLDNLRADKSFLELKLAKLDRVTKEVEDLEKKRGTLKEKLQTIATLKAKKHGPVHMLDDLNTALPERAWLVGVKEKDGNLELQGVALDNQTIASYMVNLKEKKYFRTVDLVVSTEYQQDEVKLTQFTISIALNSPIKAPQPAPGDAAAQKKPAGI